MAKPGKRGGAGRVGTEGAGNGSGRAGALFGGPDVKPRKLYKIGEIMRHTGISRQTLHNYTMMGLIQEAERTDSGHRLYGEEVFDRIEKIKMLQRHRTLREVKDLLEREPVSARK